MIFFISFQDINLLALYPGGFPKRYPLAVKLLENRLYMSRKVWTLCEVYVVCMLLLPYSDVYGICSLKCENQKEETLSTVMSYNRMFAYKQRNRRRGQFHKVFLFVFILPVIAFCLKACFN